jgi:uncharacterized protein
MSGASDNVDMLKQAYAYWENSRGLKADRWMDLCDDDIQFGSLAQGAARVHFLTAYDNRQALANYFAGITADWEMVHFTVGEFVAQDDKVVMRGTMAWRNKHTGKTVETPKVDFWRFRDGKAVEFYEYYDTARVLAAANPGNVLELQL